MKEFVVFDVDGTLVDSVDAHAKAWKKAFAEFGKEVGFERVRAEIGKGGDKLMPVFLSEKETAAFGEDLSHRRADIFKKEFLGGLKLIPGARELIVRLRAEGHRLALASSAPKDELKHHLALLGLHDSFDAVVSADDAEHSKPDPDIFLAACEGLGVVHKSQAIVVGDSPFDIEAASRAGLESIGVLSGGFSNQVLIHAGCVAVYEDVADLLRHYDTTPIARRVARASRAVGAERLGSAGNPQ